MDEDHLKSVTESLYKQNLELAIKNKTLSLLSKLYELSILALKSQELAGKIDDAIKTDFSFELVGILLYDQTKDTLTPLDFSQSERLYSAELLSKTYLESVSIPKLSENPLFKTVLQDKQMAHTEDLYQIWDSLIPKEMYEKIRLEGHVKSSILYPLIIEDKVIGVLLLSLNRLYGDLIEYEKESIRLFINVIAVALDKALLYEKLAETNDKLKEANQGQASLMHFMNHQVKGRFGNAKNIFAELLTDDYGVIPESRGDKFRC
jgi:transcriptional regulator with GAF, ATPase, and Fis domain